MTPIESLLAKSKELRDKSTKVNAWYAHSHEVRGPFHRWFTCSEVNPEYKKHVAYSGDDCAFAADAMNTSQTKDEIIRIAVAALELCASSTQFKEGEYGYQFILVSNEALSRINEIAAEVIK